MKYIQKLDLKNISEGSMLNEPKSIVYWSVAIKYFEEKNNI